MTEYIVGTSLSHEYMHHSLPDGVPLFVFPKTRRTTGATQVKHTQWRIHLNAKAYMAWDTPLFREEYEAISRWQDRHGVVFELGQRMVEYDDGSKKVRSQESFVIIHFRGSRDVSGCPSLSNPP